MTGGVDQPVDQFVAGAGYALPAPGDQAPTPEHVARGEGWCVSRSESRRRAQHRQPRAFRGIELNWGPAGEAKESQLAYRASSSVVKV